MANMYVQSALEKFKQNSVMHKNPFQSHTNQNSKSLASIYLFFFIIIFDCFLIQDQTTQQNID